MGLIRANLAYKLREEIGLAAIYENESELSEYFCQRLREIPELVSYCPANLKRLAIFSFNVKNVAPYELSKIKQRVWHTNTRWLLVRRLIRARPFGAKRGSKFHPQARLGKG